MKLSISNIAWDAEYDDEMYLYISDHGFAGLEIAPTRIFSDKPYEHLTEAKHFSEILGNQYSLTIPSIQSIWYGRTENMFGTDTEKRALIDYTKQAALFAAAMDCKNIVFGCPRNRNIPGKEHLPAAIEFFTEIGDFAASCGTIISIEPNPPFYNTNFINTTVEAFDLCRRINNAGIRVNVDLGTMIHYQESIDFINRNIELVNHIHISEPMLAVIEQRDIHRDLKKLNYSLWFSIEMKNPHNLDTVKKVVNYVKESFNDL
ncbi:MAG: endonuclease [Firmicutes bacterium HGW-Firmicutes-2]|jgi:sugar phosphate isomerase/epimerase|nr:MAG: endonuclease [Firmicutes bacterium HGW-Firmicutes-2]